LLRRPSKYERTCDISQEVADDFVEALRKLEEDREVGALIGIQPEDCEVGNVSVPETFRGHEGLREFWTEYRKTFDEMKSTFRNVFATEEGAALEWTTEGTSNGNAVSYDGVSILKIEGGKPNKDGHGVGQCLLKLLTVGVRSLEG